MNDAHVALIVEDDPHIANVLKALVTSLGHKWIHVMSLEEVRAAIAAGGYCYVLLDMQIPADASSNPEVGCGETALKLLRRAAPARTAAGKHVLPIVIVTGYSREPDFVAKMFDMDADGFIAKPFGERNDLTLDKIRAPLLRAEREDHEACLAGASSRSPVAPVRPTASEPVQGAPEVRLEIDGTGAGGRTFVFVNRARVSLQDGYFGVFISLVAAHTRTPGAWMAPEKLGIATRGWAASRVRAAFKGALPAGFDIVETRRGTGFRLNPVVMIERVEWEALRGHGQAQVRKAAGEAMAGRAVTERGAR